MRRRPTIFRKPPTLARSARWGSGDYVSDTLYSLVASAERHGLDPQRYLTGVLARIAGTPVSQLDKVLPDQWNASHVQPARTVILT